MNITRLNFKETLPYILNSISEANYVALDFQMSGLMSAYTLDPSLTDSIETRYHKYKSKAQRFIPLQLGLCPVKIQDKNILYSPFNIYLYPLALLQRQAEQFTFNSQSMRFLAKNHFDFNRLFYQGVPFLSPRKVKKFEVKVEQIKQKEEQTKRYMLQSPDIAAFLNLKLGEVVNWVSLEKKPQQNNNQTNQNNQKQLLIDIQFVRVRAYQSLIYTIKKKYPSLSLKFQYLDINKNKLDSKNFLARKYIKITKLTPQQVQKLSAQNNNQSKQNEADRLAQSLQFNQIWQKIKQKNVPLIVHNGFLDMMHLYHRFIDDLPASQNVYREEVHKQFPVIYDTKYICNNNPILFNSLNKDTSLGNCYKMLRNMQKQQIAKLNQSQNQKKQSQPIQIIKSQISPYCNQYKFDQQQHHEAGFDALMTGYNFVHALKLLHYPPEKIATRQFIGNSKYFCNKIPLGNIRLPFNFDVPNKQYQQDGATQIYFTCLEQNIDNISTPQTFLAKQAEIYNHFTKYHGPVKIVWENRNLLNFTLTFLKTQDEKGFLKILDNYGYSLYSIEKKDRYLISSKILKQKTLFTANKE